MLGTVPQHKEWGDTNNSYGWNWKRSTWFPVCNPNMTNRKWTSIYRALLYFNWSPKAFFHMKYWEKNTPTFWLADDLLYFLSHLTAGITVIVILLWNMCSSVPTKVQNPKISNHVKPSSCWSKSSLSADQTVSIYYLQVKMKLATVGNI